MICSFALGCWMLLYIYHEYHEHVIMFVSEVTQIKNVFTTLNKCLSICILYFHWICDNKKLDFFVLLLLYNIHSAICCPSDSAVKRPGPSSKPGKGILEAWTLTLDHPNIRGIWEKSPTFVLNNFTPWCLTLNIFF